MAETECPVNFETVLTRQLKQSVGEWPWETIAPSVAFEASPNRWSEGAPRQFGQVVIAFLKVTGGPRRGPLLCPFQFGSDHPPALRPSQDNRLYKRIGKTAC